MIAPESENSPNQKILPESGRQQQIWQTFREELGSVLVVGHGTRNPNGARQLLEIVGHMQAKEPYANIFGCFLELAEPTIEQAIEQLHNRGIKRILVVPVLLFTAAHALEDIPDAVALAAARFGIQVIGQTGSLGTHDSVVALSQPRTRKRLSGKRLRKGSVPIGPMRRTGQTHGSHWTRYGRTWDERPVGPRTYASVDKVKNQAIFHRSTPNRILCWRKTQPGWTSR